MEVHNFRREINLSYISNRRMEAASSFKKLVLTYQSKWRHIPQYRILINTSVRTSKLKFKNMTDENPARSRFFSLQQVVTKTQALLAIIWYVT